MNKHPINDEELSVSTSANVSCFRCMNPTGLQDEELTNNLNRPQPGCMCRFQNSAAEVQDEELTALSAYPCTTCSNLCSRNNPAAFHDEELTAWSATPYAARICTFVVEKDEDLAMNVEAQRQCFYCRPSPAELQDEDLSVKATQMHCGACFCTHTQVKVQDEELTATAENQTSCNTMCTRCFISDDELSAATKERPMCFPCRVSTDDQEGIKSAVANGPRPCTPCFTSKLEDEELASAPELQLRQCYRCASPSSADLPTD